MAQIIAIQSFLAPYFRIVVVVVVFRSDLSVSLRTITSSHSQNIYTVTKYQNIFISFTILL